MSYDYRPCIKLCITVVTVNIDITIDMNITITIDITITITIDITITIYITITVSISICITVNRSINISVFTPNTDPILLTLKSDFKNLRLSNDYFQSLFTSNCDFLSKVAAPSANA